MEKDQEAKIKELFYNATKEIDGTEVLNRSSLKMRVEKVFEIDFDFGDLKNDFENMKSEIKTKVESKLNSLNEEIKRREETAKQEAVNRINNVREGLLDKIFQMDADNHQVDLEYIKDALDQDNPFPEMEEKFNAMIETVKKNLDSKMKMINAELEQRKQEAIDARIAIDARTTQRGKQLEKIGFIFNEQKTENFWNTLVSDFEVWESMVEGLSDEDWTLYFNEIKKSMEDAKAKNKAFQERQKAFKKDKESMIDYLNSNAVQLNLSAYCDNEETVKLAEEIEKSFQLFIETKIETINKF